MAHIRDFRRRAYLEAIRTELGSSFAETTTDLDQVLYNPRRLVWGPSRTRSGPGSPRDVNGALEQVRNAGHASLEPRPRAEWQPLSSTLQFDVPEQDDLDARAVASQLNERFPDEVAPLYYTLTQQYAQPGEDPEASPPLRNLLPSASRPSPGSEGLGKGVRIAVLDTGIDEGAVDAAKLRQQEFDPGQDLDRLLDPTCTGDAAGLLGPAAGHGTFIASLIHMVAPGATVRSYRVAGPLGFADELDIADGIRRAIDDGAHVINLSLGGYPFSEKSAGPTLRSFSILQAAVSAIPDEVAVVAAAGNCGSSDEFFPAAFPRVIGVVALDRGGRLWEHSNYGSWVRACTRGVAVRGLFVQGRENPAFDPDGKSETWDDPVNFATWTGTSFAAPLVAGQIAVMAAQLGLIDNTREAAEHLLGVSRPPHDPRDCGKRILVDIPGQT